MPESCHWGWRSAAMPPKPSMRPIYASGACMQCLCPMCRPILLGRFVGGCDRVTVTTRKGFTLIELLVVIAIIGILASMVFPVFARARESARKAVCLSNVKNIALAVQMYLADNNDRFWTGDDIFWRPCVRTVDVGPLVDDDVRLGLELRREQRRRADAVLALLTVLQ